MSSEQNPVNVLAPMYPTWKANCLESARWLRSGAEYEDWHSSRGMTPAPLDDREKRALDYEMRAARYDDPGHRGA